MPAALCKGTARAGLLCRREAARRWRLRLAVPEALRLTIRMLRACRTFPVRAKRSGTPIDVTGVPQGKFDIVLCDVPCSGTGAWRRKPEAKWTLTAERLAELCSLQNVILDEARGVRRAGRSAGLFDLFVPER